MLIKFECKWCSSQCERIPYPRGNRFLCTRCGEDYFDAEASKYREEQRKRMRELLDQIPKNTGGNDELN